MYLGCGLAQLHTGLGLGADYDDYDNDHYKHDNSSSDSHDDDDDSPDGEYSAIVMPHGSEFFGYWRQLASWNPLRLRRRPAGREKSLHTRPGQVRVLRLVLHFYR